jgi:hypothetical protein
VTRATGRDSAVPRHLDLRLATQRRADLLAQRVEVRVIVAENRALGVGAAVRRGQTERAEHARGAGDEDLRHAELLGDGCGVQRPGAAEGQQGEAPRVDAALDGHDAQGAGHLGVGHAHDPSAQATSRPSSSARRLTAACAASASSATSPASGTSALRWPRTRLASVTVGLGAAAPVAGRPGLGARAARADAQRAAGIAPADRAAAGPDGVDVDHRQRQRPAADLAPSSRARGRPRRRTRRTSAAHVEAQQVGLAAALGEQGRRGGAAGRPLSTVRAAWSAAASSAARPPLDCMIAGVGRPASRDASSSGAGSARAGREGGVDLGRRRALELAEGADDLVRQRDVHPEALAQRGADRALVVGMAVAVQQADRDRLGLGAATASTRPRGRQRLEHAVGPGALARREAPLRPGSAARVGGAQSVELAPGLAAEGDDVGEAVRRDEGRARHGALEQRVGRDRHPVGEALDVARLRAGVGECALDSGHDAARLVVGRRRRLGRVHDAVDDQDGIREGAAHVDAQEHPRTLDDARRSTAERPSSPLCRR